MQNPWSILARVRAQLWVKHLAHRFLRAVLATWLAVFMLTLPAQAGEGDTFRPVLQYNYGHEDNLFRLADSTPAFSEGRSDSYQSLGAGFDVDWKQSRQQLLLSALVSQTKYGKYSLLDYDGKNATAEWKWQLGNRLRGNLGTDYRVYQGTYLDTSGLVGNVRTQRQRYGTAVWGFHSNWEAELRHSKASQDYEAAAQASSNYDQDDTTLGLFYKGGQMERLGLEYSTLDGRYPDRTNPLSATRYDRNTLNLVANWLPTGKTLIKARIGHVNRKDNVANQGNVSGINTRLDINWVPTGKTQVSLAAYRTLENSELNSVLGTADSQDITGLNGAVQWQVLPKVWLGANLTLEQHEYNGISLDEILNTAGLSATYRPRPDANLSLSLSKQQRHSNILSREFDATTLSISALVRF
jgi:exopolysaccharide biosynthesis operon protein EpsL